MTDNLADLGKQNPWVHLPTVAPFVLPADWPTIEAFHRHESEQWRYRLDLPPDPWQGRWDAPLLLLLQNPSLGGEDDITYASNAVRAANRRNMTDNAGQEPMYWLEDDVAHTYSGKWWRSRLRSLINDAGLSIVRDNLLVVELYGYRSRTFRPLPITLQSQAFGLSIVRSAIGREATILLPRASRYWEIALPELHDYHHLVRGKPKTRGAYVSPGNLESGGYERVMKAITAPARGSYTEEGRVT